MPGKPRPLGALALLVLCLCVGPVLAAPAAATQTRSAISFGVEPVKLKRGATAVLSATVKPAGTCAGRSVLFQIDAGGGWKKLGKEVEVDRSCHVSRKVKVTRPSEFRVLLRDPKRSVTLVTSPSVTVKVS